MRSKITNAARNPVALLSLVRSALVFILVCSVVLAQGVADSSVVEVHIGVLGLFHPLQFTVSAPAGSALVLHAGQDSIVLEKTSGVDSASARISGSDVVVSAGNRAMRSSRLTVSGRRNEPVNFVLAVPQKIVRRYYGTLEIKPSAGTLIAVVAMDRETAVSSVVAAESTPDAPFDALKAQAVAARSYFVAGH